MKKIIDFLLSYRVLFLWSLFLFLVSLVLGILDDFYLYFCEKSGLIGGFLALSCTWFLEGLFESYSSKKSRQDLDK